jgi:hypothetical protein
MMIAARSMRLGGYADAYRQIGQFLEDVYNQKRTLTELYPRHSSRRDRAFFGSLME